MTEPSNRDRVVTLLRNFGHARLTAAEIAERLDLPVGTVNASTSGLIRESWRHRGSGVYAFKDPGQRARLYSWCESWPQDAAGPLAKTTRKRSTRGTEFALQLVERFDIAQGIYADADGAYYQVKPVQVRTVVVLPDPFAENEEAPDERG